MKRLFLPFIKKELGFLFGIGLSLALLLIPMRNATSSVIKMPKPLPNIVKSYKSVKVVAGVPGMKYSGVEVGQGDFITILAKGMIDAWPSSFTVHSGMGSHLALRTIDQSYQEGYRLGPKRLLLIRIGEKDPMEYYRGPEIIEILEEGKIYLGYRGSEVDSSGEPLKPRYFDDDLGSFEVDIIVWKTKDANLMAKFLQETSLSQPKDKDLKEMAKDFKKRLEVLVALLEKTKEVE